LHSSFFLIGLTAMLLAIQSYTIQTFGFWIGYSVPSRA
jgi:hypothetical protein